jgi:formate dehydrogenase iron-sulfur subunit
VKTSASWTTPGTDSGDGLTLIDDLLNEQRTLTAVERFARVHDRHDGPALEKHYRRLLPANAPKPGQQYAFEVDLDKCSGCKSCVSACHSLNGLDEHETWRSVGLLVSSPRNTQHATRVEDEDEDENEGRGGPSRSAFQQHITTACHHCADPGCLNGCPVLAYDKDPVTGIVRHLDDQCIGCSYCIMKCPYEVPKYSDRLGIVRKCDMCANRLSVGEAPACVQACPDEAIKITLVDSALAIGYRQSAIKNFLPDSPDPALTLPTTRYISKRGLPESVQAADHDALRLDHAHWPLVVMLVLTQAAAGMFVTGVVLEWPGSSDARTLIALGGFGMLVAGLTAAVFHLGQPLKAWRAFLGWRTSWLSREIILFNAFAGVATAVLAALWLPQLITFVPMLMAGTAAAGLAGVFASAMVYVDTGRRLWSPRIVFGNFFGSALLLGASFGAAAHAWSGGPMRMALLAAVLVHGCLFAWRQLEIQAALQDSDSPVHFAARVIRELLPRVQSARVALFALFLLLVLLALGNAGNAAVVWASGAALTAFAGELIGRYVFFVAGAGKRMPGGVAA